MEDFSLNLLCRGGSHLLPATLDSLKFQEGVFEVILLDAEGKGRLHELAKRYEGLPIRVVNARGCTLPQMMNLGVAQSKGKYIQFLEPGSRYLSRYGLSFVKGLLQTEPLLISARGVAPDVRSHWLLRKSIVDAGGFDEAISSSPMLDYLCRLQKKGVEPTVCTRAVIDAPHEPKGSLIETGRILYRHFGLSYTLRWLIRDRIDRIRRFASLFKQAFQRQETE